ncbi:MAG: Uma2 family endonuclease, partial [Planctomycetes bacterium]|nr:Uma2 family endonuclease [Planctomycetota bacterium]
MEKRIAALPGNDRARARREALRAEREAKERELEAALTSGALARLSQGEKRRLRES